MTRLAETDPEFFQYLAENDQQLLEFSGDEGAGEETDDSEDDGMGRPEPVPTSVTSRSEVCIWWGERRETCILIKGPMGRLFY